MNIFVNTKSLRSSDAKAIEEQTESLLDEYLPKAEETAALVVNGKIKCTDFRHQECTLSRQELLSFSPQSAHFHHSW